MTLFVQIIIQQWDKGQNTPEESEARGRCLKARLLSREKAVYFLNKQGVIEQVGDDRLGDRIGFSQLDNQTVRIDRFFISLNDKTLAYSPSSELTSLENLGSIDERFVQCHYQWRYRVFEGGFYYWLYEDITFNFIFTDTFDERVFLTHKPTAIAVTPPSK